MFLAVVDKWEGEITLTANTGGGKQKNKRKENPHAEREAMQNVASLSLNSDCKISMRKV